MESGGGGGLFTVTVEEDYCISVYPGVSIGFSKAYCHQRRLAGIYGTNFFDVGSRRARQ